MVKPLYHVRYKLKIIFRDAIDMEEEIFHCKILTFQSHSLKYKYIIFDYI